VRLHVWQADFFAGRIWIHSSAGVEQLSDVLTVQQENGLVQARHLHVAVSQGFEGPQMLLLVCQAEQGAHRYKDRGSGEVCWALSLLHQANQANLHVQKKKKFARAPHIHSRARQDRCSFCNLIIKTAAACTILPSKAKQTRATRYRDIKSSAEHPIEAVEVRMS